MTVRSNRLLIILYMLLFCGGQAFAADDAKDTLAKPTKAMANEQDRREQPPKDYNGYFPWTPLPTKEAWQVRAEQVRRQLLVATGLWPTPEHRAPKATIHGKVERDGYTVERVYFDTYPGLYLTGSLYRPAGKTGKMPGVLFPHGHWNEGRFHVENAATVKKQIEQGAEQFEVGGRYPLQALPVQLARMGCVVFHYDMLGYADNTQIGFQLSHKFNKRRPEMETPENWGLYSPQAELHLQSVMGIQTFNSICALDFLSNLPDVDAKRIGCTGASGGGTQTFLLAALDPRVSVAFPAVMVSTSMQGGCTCENCDYLRTETGNIELAALIAPRPLGMSGANDWTKELLTKGYPELQRHYAMMGAADNVTAQVFPQFEHNYNSVSRGVMYQWFNKHLKLDLPEPIKEQDYKPLTVAEMTVWDADHPRPATGPDVERQILATITKINDKQLADLKPHDATSLKKFREVVGGAWQTMLGNELGTEQIKSRIAKEGEGKALLEVSRGVLLMLEETERGILIPALDFGPRMDAQTPADENGPQNVLTICLRKDGYHEKFLHAKERIEPASTLVRKGQEVLGVDLFGQGSHSPNITKNRRVKGDRDYAGFTYGYNLPLFSQRCRDVVDVIRWQTTIDPKRKINLVAMDETAPLAIAARAMTGNLVSRLLVNTGNFRFAKLAKYPEYDDAYFLPGAAKYGDLPALLALNAPNETWIAGEKADDLKLATEAYLAAEARDHLHFSSEKDSSAAVEWLLSK